MAYYELGNDTARDIWVREADGTTLLLVGTEANERGARFSADGEWLAYVSNEQEGQDQVYVKQYPNGARQVVSTTEAREPV